MTTATIERNANTAGFKVMKSQAVEKLAEQLGVQYYTEKTQYNRNGYGIRMTPLNRGFGDQTKIIIEANQGLYGDNTYMRTTVAKMAHENFLMKLELWALKNNVQYVVTNEDRHHYYFQIIAE
jgi:hypothetical protein